MKKTAKITLLSDYIGSNSDFESRDNYKFQEYEELYNALKKLKDAQRIPIVLKYLSGFTDEETAHILDININTLKSRVHKGKEKLRKIIENSFEGGLKNGQR
jgi:RNA polymerase sigma-70 factor (ECF subfamily)